MRTNIEIDDNLMPGSLSVTTGTSCQGLERPHGAQAHAGAAPPQIVFKPESICEAMQSLHRLKPSLRKSP